jgi:hypothetical protein
MMARLQFISLWTAAKHRQGWKKNHPSAFFGFFGFFGFFYVFAQKREDFLGFFSVSRILLGASRL